MKILLPDGSERELPRGASAYDLAASIGEGLAKAALGARVNGELYDVHRPLAEAASAAGTPGPSTPDPSAPLEVAIITAPRLNKKGIPSYRDESHKADALYLLRHSAAHVMAEAIEKLWPDTKLAYGPPLDNGFYYDLQLDTPISSDDFEKIETEMMKIVGEDRPFFRYDLTDLEMAMSPSSGKLTNKYKVDNAKRAIEAGATSLSFYVTGEYGEASLGNGKWDRFGCIFRASLSRQV